MIRIIFQVISFFSFQVSGGYYQMGNIFHKQNQIDLVSSFFDKVVTILKNTLKPDFTKLDRAQIAEGINMLGTIKGFRINYAKGTISTAEVDFVYGLLYKSSSNFEKAKEYTSRALTGKGFDILIIAFESALGREHTLTNEVRNLMKQIVSGNSEKGMTPTTSKSQEISTPDRVSF